MEAGPEAMMVTEQNKQWASSLLEELRRGAPENLKVSGR